jgi:hypothetical protein
MQRLLRHACHATNLLREREVPLKLGLIALVERSYDAILAAAWRSTRRSQPWQRPEVAADRRNGLAIISCCA